ncbi:hypothetical protein G6L37_35065 [Agrobacterium rubi]|nr:hypothetical protein [Agrobacterium rubi]NTF23791.1 hypothetical protein [Agrobacterium rubi]
MTWKTNVENLIRTGSLKPADYIEEDVAQYVADAAGYFRDAKLVTTPQSRFLLSYEGLHALSMAVLNKAEVRVDSGDGHRQTALQVALLVSDINALQPGAATAVMQLHRTRNSKTYHSPLPPVSDTQADTAFKTLDLMLTAACTFLEIERPE